MGSISRRGKPRFGELTPAAGLAVGSLGKSVLTGTLQQVLFTVLTALLPHLALAIVTAYYAYTVGQQLLDVKKEYEAAKGTPEQKAVKVAIKEGFKRGLGAIVDATVGTRVHDAIDSSVNTTAAELSKAEVFDRISSKIEGSNPQSADDLRTLYIASAKGILQSVANDVSDEIVDYVTEEITR